MRMGKVLRMTHSFLIASLSSTIRPMLAFNCDDQTGIPFQHAPFLSPPWMHSPRSMSPSSLYTRPDPESQNLFLVSLTKAVVPFIHFSFCSAAVISITLSSSLLTHSSESFSLLLTGKLLPETTIDWETLAF